MSVKSEFFVNGQPVTPAVVEPEPRLSNDELQRLLYEKGQARRQRLDREASEDDSGLDELAREQARRIVVSQAAQWYNEQAEQLRGEVPGLIAEAAQLRAERARLGPEVERWLERERAYHQKVFEHYRRSEQASNTRASAGRPTGEQILIDAITEWLNLLGVNDDALRTIHYSDKDILGELAQEKLAKSFYNGHQSLRGRLSNVYRNYLQFAKPVEVK